MEGNFWTGWFNDKCVQNTVTYISYIPTYLILSRSIPDIAQGRLYELPPRLQFDDVPLLTAGPPQPLKGGQVCTCLSLLYSYLSLQFQNQLGTDQALEPSFGFISVPTGNGGRAQQIHAD